MSVFNINKKAATKRKMFLDGGVDIQRYDDLKYKQIDKMTERQLGFFWQPNEVDLSRDSKDFKELTEHEKHICTENLLRWYFPEKALSPDGMCINPEKIELEYWTRLLLRPLFEHVKRIPWTEG